MHPTDAILIRNGTQTEEGAEPQKNDSYTYGDYRYKYSTNNNGWSVEVITRQKTEYGPILESINGKPIVALGNTFACCTNLTTAPVIPSGVTNMYYTFWACTSLTTAPIIPYLYNKLRAVIGDNITLTSQTYRNSEYTVFIRMGSMGGNQASAQDAVAVYGQWNGTNL